MKYQDLWFTLIKNNKNIPYNIIYFEDWKEIKNQYSSNHESWLEKIKRINNSYEEISRLYEFANIINPIIFIKNSKKL